MAAAQGKSLKTYIETILITNANAVSVEVSEYPSPSGDRWFDDAENIAELDDSIRRHKEGKTKACTIEEIRDLRGGYELWN